MVSHLTNNETYFFREAPQLTVFADHVVKQLKDKKGRDGSRSFRILSAGCSTGEEALTLAMIVYDSGQFFWNWDVRVTGLDVDDGALGKARPLPPELVPGHEPGPPRTSFHEAGRGRAGEGGGAADGELP